MIKSDKERLLKIKSYCDKLSAAIKERNITKEMIMTDEFTQWSVTTPLYNIGEQVYNLSSELKEKHSAIPWSRISGLRHRLVHSYDSINWTFIVEAIFDDLPKLAQEVNEIIEKDEK